MTEKNMTLIEHLEELRRVFIISIVAVLVAAAASYFAFGEQIFELIMRPLKEFGVPLIYIGVTEAFITKIKVSIFAGIILALPIILWQFWSFIVPALHRHEKKYFYLLVPTSLVLFAAGVLFAYTTVLRFAVRFLMVVSGEGLEAMISVGKYVTFLFAFLIPFGFVFQLPLVVFFLTRMGLITPQFLSRNRKYAILVMVVVAAVLTPPDVISQMLLGGPMILLYEISILISRLVKARKKEILEEEE